MPRPKHTSTPIGERVIRRISLARRAKHLTQEKLAEMVGVTVESISRYEGGRLGLSLEMLDRIARALDLPIETLLRDSPPGLTAEETELLDCWQGIDEEGRRRMLLLLRWMSEDDRQRGSKEQRSGGD